MSDHEDVLRLSWPRLWAVRAKDESPRLAELGHPLRYLRNQGLVKRLRDGSYTMLGKRRARNLVELARRLELDGVPGALVDCGTWNGGSTILMGAGAPSRRIWAFDSFAGLPKPGPRDTDIHSAWEGKNVASPEMVAEGFRRYAGEPSRLKIVKGWFEETLPGAAERIGPIALLHIDADWYDSIRLALDTFYDHVAEGGYIAIDDLKSFQGAWDATAEFRLERGVQEPIQADHYWRKSR